MTVNSTFTQSITISPCNMILLNLSYLKLKVSLKNDNNIIAWQWGAKFDINSLEVVKIGGLNPDNFHHNKEVNAVTALNFVSEGYFSDSECLTIILKAKKNIVSLENLVRFDNELIENVAFDINQNAINDEFNYEFTKNASRTVSISPNPFKESITLNLPNVEGESQLSMSDAMGRTVLSKMVLGKQITLDSDLSNLSKGIYFIDITLPNGERVQQKLLKQ